MLLLQKVLLIIKNGMITIMFIIHLLMLMKLFLFGIEQELFLVQIMVSILLIGLRLLLLLKLIIRIQIISKVIQIMKIIKLLKLMIKMELLMFLVMIITQVLMSMSRKLNNIFKILLCNLLRLKLQRELLLVEWLLTELRKQNMMLNGLQSKLKNLLDLVICFLVVKIVGMRRLITLRIELLICLC